MVDDAPHVRLDTKRLLQQQGIERTWEAANGQEALAMVARYQPELVILDITIPLMSGREVLGILAQERRRLPVILLTAQSSMKTVLECMKLGATAYILKHSPRAEAVQALREAPDALTDAADTAEGAQG